jgi:hypothetical protein
MTFQSKCGKVIFPTRKEAKAAIKLINKQGSRKRKTLTDVYWCDPCSGYHMTSMAKQSSRDFNRHKRKLKK